jgi:hypothetical protein
MGSFSQITTPQMPPLHLLTRTLASPACVSQIPLTSPPDCALAIGAASNSAKVVTIKPNLHAIGPPKKAGLLSSKSGACNGIFAADHSVDRALIGLANMPVRAHGRAQGSPGQAA